MTSPNELAEQFLPLTLTGSFNPLISILTISLRKLCAVFFSLQHIWLAVHVRRFRISMQAVVRRQRSRNLTATSKFLQTHKGALQLQSLKGVSSGETNLNWPRASLFTETNLDTLRGEVRDIKPPPTRCKNLIN